VKRQEPIRRLEELGLRHILDQTSYIAGKSQGLTKAEFLSDDTLKRAFVRSLEIIGEARKKITDDKKKYPQVEWRLMAGMPFWKVRSSRRPGKCKRRWS
jgi:uncharacterized protein with HEPN domain